MITPNKYSVNFKFITKEGSSDDPFVGKKIVLKVSIIADGAMIDEHFLDLLWWTHDGENTNMSYCNGFKFQIPPTSLQLKEKILIWILTLGLFCSIIGHILR